MGTLSLSDQLWVQPHPVELQGRLYFPKLMRKSSHLPQELDSIL